MSDAGSAGTSRTRAHVPRLTGPDVASVFIGLLGVGLIVVLFFAWNWQCLPVRGQSFCAEAVGVISGWADFGVVAGVAAGCLVLWEAVSVAGALVLTDQTTEPLVATGLGLTALVFALLRVLTMLRGITTYAWLGLALAACLFAIASARLLAAGLGRSQR